MINHPQSPPPRTETNAGVWWYKTKVKMTTTKISKGRYHVEFNDELYLLNTIVSNGIVRCWAIKKNGERVASCRTKKNALLFLKTNNWWYTHPKA